MIKNKKLIYGVLIVLLIVASGLAIVNKSNFLQKVVKKEGTGDIFSELEKLDIEVTGDPQQFKIMILSGDRAFWEYQEEVCKQGGYGLLSRFGGEDALYISYDIGNEVYKHSDRKTYPLKVNVITIGGRVVCVYKAVEGIIPGLFSVKNPLIIKTK